MKYVIQSVRLMLFMTLITGVVYPVLVMLVGKLAFAEKAEGSFLTREGKVIGSSLIGQKFESPRYFKSRPSAVDYNPAPSGGTNLAPTSKKLRDSVQAARAALGDGAPKDLLYASGSGVDPHISPEAALFQVASVAKARGFDQAKADQLKALIEAQSHGRDLGFLGEPTVNVLELNLAIDRM